MTHEEKFNYMNIAASICNMRFSIEQTDLLISLYDGVCKYKGKYNLEQVLKIKSDVKGRAVENIKEVKK